MARSFNGSSTYINCGNPTISGTVYTISIWIRPTANSGTFIARTNTTSGNPIYFDLDLSSGTARMLVRDEAGNIATSTKASSYSAGTWTHFLGVRNGNDVLVYVNGVAGTLATATFGVISTGTVNDILNIGARALGSTTRTVFLTGDAAFAAIWEAELNTSEITALSKGISPDKIRPSSLVFHAPLIRATDDIMGLATNSDNGPTGVAASPRIYR